MARRSASPIVDARRGSKVADLCDDCAGGMPGRAAARRGRRPKTRRRERTNRRGAAAGTVLRPLYDGKVGLSLLAGPANAGKVALLLERYLARLDDEPYLIVPNASDVDRVERDLLARCGCLFSGAIGTFDDLFRRLVADDPARRPVATDAQRALIVRRALGGGVAERARALRAHGRVRRLAARDARRARVGLLDPGDLDGDLAGLYAAYRAELDRLGLWDRDLLPAPRGRAARRPSSTPGTASRSSPTASRT